MPSIVFVLSFLFLTSCVSSLKVVTTSYGRLRGITEWSDNENHKYIFKGIPFAKPPIENLRFALPEDPDPWSDVLDASKYSSACMSNVTQTRFPQKEVSEDCLYLNVFTSEKCLTKKCAVIVYFHGGSYKVDSAIMFPDNFILERYVSEDVVFAIPAYRLGAFGQLFFGPNDALTENLLIFDAVKSLHFIHNEIESFGGDPNRVTLMGHSAGATLIDAIGFSKLIDPDASLFQQMISFSAHGEFGFADLAIQNSYELTEKLGCLSTKSSTHPNVADILNCLRKLSGDEIMKVQSSMIDTSQKNWKSIIRGAPFMEYDGKISELKRDTPARNIICGSTESEFLNDTTRYTAAGTFLDFENPHSVLDHYYEVFEKNDWVDPLSAGVYISARTYCEAMSNAGADAYIFETRQKPFSGHVTDMQYFIGIHREDVHTKDMDILDSFYSKMLVNFTKTGVPSPEWEKLDPKKMNYLDLKVDSEKHEGPVMLNGFHNKITKIWYEEVTEFDKSINEKETSNTTDKYDSPYTKGITTSTSNLTSTTSSSRPFIKNTTEVTTTEVSENQQSKFRKNKMIFEQWWFYLIILLVIMLVVLVFISQGRTKQEEDIPLLG